MVDSTTVTSCVEGPFTYHSKVKFIEIFTLIHPTAIALGPVTATHLLLAGFLVDLCQGLLHLIVGAERSLCCWGIS
eukprot:Skav202786  [mRNA]  locus=scaffold326:529989:530216:- [translate_table: standard]